MNQNRTVRSMKIAVIVILALLLIYYLLFRSPKTVAVVSPPVVIIEKPKLVNMREYVSQTGNTVAYNSVDLVARVEGYLQDIQFTDGTFVDKGKTLFLIEPEPYQDKLKEAQASLEAQQAGLAYAKAEYARQQRMYKENATSLNNVEVWQARRDQAQAEVEKAKANLDTATINYSYTQVKAPFYGRIGRHLVDVGNLVGNGAATTLATIEQINPIYVYFNLNELDLIKLRAAARAYGFKPEDINKIPVYVALQNETGFPHKGHLDFISTGLNASTGTMQFRALLPNKDLILVPGLFVKVRIAISKPSLQLTVPDTAVQYDQIGPYLLLVDKNNLVVQKRVQTGEIENGRQAILKGLTAKDEVIINGLQFATPGSPVTPHPPKEENK
ncbi:efflux RND transporter periplasmic adaptor subunit [Legionella israelensis]|nr:efflux RND transporter periplasmic adaptor subunit [Legionella israelensis]